MSYYLHRNSNAVVTVAKYINTGESCVLCADMVTVLSENMMILERPGLITTHNSNTTDMNNREKAICIAVTIAEECC